MRLLLPLLMLGPFVLGSASPVPEEEPTWVVYEGQEGPGKGKHIVLVAGDEEYRSEEALPMLGKVLAKHHGFRCTVLFSTNEAGEIDPDARGRIQGLHHLDDADLMILFTRFRRLPDEDMKHIVDFVEAGKPVFGIRTATHAFAYEKDSESPYARWNWNDGQWSGGFGKQVLGETWVNHHGHHGSESTRGVVPEQSREHPIVRGVVDAWGPTDVYGIRALPADAQVILEGVVLNGMTEGAEPTVDDRTKTNMPVTWIRERELEGGLTQRVFASTLGAAIDLRSEGLRRVFVNGAYWCMGMEDAIPERSVVDTVGPYEPTMFGFGGFKKGVRPADHAWSPAPAPSGDGE